MEYIRITKENIDKEHICCAMSGKQSLAKKEWLKQRFEEGLVFYRSAERGKCFIVSPSRKNGQEKCEKSSINSFILQCNWFCILYDFILHIKFISSFHYFRSKLYRMGNCYYSYNF